jgi:D-beta-D-heptose 7-phosphate kinase/D-beta-D-heptose 1-phosphate adenosyltransferase
MLNFLQFFTVTEPNPAIVIGDLMLDSYITGRVNRISPEAPIPVFDIDSEYHLAGGAGNVALNIAGMKVPVSLVSRVGDDLSGDEILSQLGSAQVDCSLVSKPLGYVTSVKKRVIASGQQLLRMDKERITPFPEFPTLLPILEQMLSPKSVLALSDYQKGLFSPENLRMLLALAAEKEVITIVDPKGNDFRKYYGATVIKPNRSEAYQAAGLSREEPLELVAQRLFEITQAQYLLITLSEEGLVLFDADGNWKRFPAVAHEVRDVTGAGDTVLATLVAGISRGLGLEEAAELANIAAGIAVQKIGCAQVSLSLLAQTLAYDRRLSKIFRPDTAVILEYALASKPVELIQVGVGEYLAPDIYRTIERIKMAQPDHEVVVHLQLDPTMKHQRRENNLGMGEEVLSTLLASLQEVDWVYISHETLPEVSSRFLVSQAHTQRL